MQHVPVGMARLQVAPLAYQTSMNLLTLMQGEVAAAMTNGSVSELCVNVPTQESMGICGHLNFSAFHSGAQLHLQREQTHLKCQPQQQLWQVQGPGCIQDQWHWLPGVRTRCKHCITSAVPLCHRYHSHGDRCARAWAMPGTQRVALDQEDDKVCVPARPSEGPKGVDDPAVEVLHNQCFSPQQDQTV